MFQSQGKFLVIGYYFAQKFIYIASLSIFFFFRLFFKLYASQTFRNKKNLPTIHSIKFGSNETQQKATSSFSLNNFITKLKFQNNPHTL